MPIIGDDKEQMDPINFADTCPFSQYFDQDDRFEEARRFYKQGRYGVGIPEALIDGIKNPIVEYYFELVIVEQEFLFWVVVERDKESNDILLNLLARQTKSGQELPIMKDKSLVEKIINQINMRVEYTESSSRNRGKESMDPTGTAGGLNGSYKYPGRGGQDKRTLL